VRKVIVSEFVSLDGIIEGPSWTFRFTSEEQEKFKFDELAASDALLLGRVTYEGFAAAWPNMMEQYSGPRRAELGQYADMMNGYPKFVVSRTLEEPLEWNNSTLIEGNVAEEVSRLKQQPGKDILVFGSGDLVNTLMHHDLIDEYRLMVFPVVVGSGKRLFGDDIEKRILRLIETKTFGSGVAVLYYRPAVEEAEG
jgi:dihydrofolate reductase